MVIGGCPTEESRGLEPRTIPGPHSCTYSQAYCIRVLAVLSEVGSTCLGLERFDVGTHSACSDGGKDPTKPRKREVMATLAETL